MNTLILIDDKKKQDFANLKPIPIFTYSLVFEVLCLINNWKYHCITTVLPK